MGKLLPYTDLAPGEIIYAQGTVDVQVAGTVKLLLNSPKGLKLWLDDHPVNNLTAPSISPLVVIHSPSPSNALNETPLAFAPNLLPQLSPPPSTTPEGEF